MWFSKKPRKKSWEEETEEKLKAFRDIGETFNYLGRKCIVTAYSYFYGMGICPTLVCDYVDEAGIIRQITFGVTELPGLINQNPS